MKNLILMLFVLMNYQAQSQIIQIQERANYGFFIFTDTPVSQIILRSLPRGARVEYFMNKATEKKSTLTQMLDTSDGKLKFWYRNNWLLTPCKIIIYQSKKIIAEKIFWANAELIGIEKKELAAGKYVLQIINNGLVLEERDFEINESK
jgi:hypothetical protein